MPPGPYGTMTLTACIGHSCASAALKRESNADCKTKNNNKMAVPIRGRARRLRMSSLRAFVPCPLVESEIIFAPN